MAWKGNQTKLNPSLTLTLRLPGKHRLYFTDCMKVSFWWVRGKLGLARLRRDARFARSNPSLPRTHQKLTFIQLVCLIVGLLCRDFSQIMFIHSAMTLGTAGKKSDLAASYTYVRLTTVTW